MNGAGAARPAPSSLSPVLAVALVLRLALLPRHRPRRRRRPALPEGRRRTCSTCPGIPYQAPRLYPYPPVWMWVEAGSEWLARATGMQLRAARDGCRCWRPSWRSSRCSRAMAGRARGVGLRPPSRRACSCPPATASSTRSRCSFVLLAVRAQRARRLDAAALGLAAAIGAEVVPGAPAARFPPRARRRVPACACGAAGDGAGGAVARPVRLARRGRAARASCSGTAASPTSAGSRSVRGAALPGHGCCWRGARRRTGRRFVLAAKVAFLRSRTGRSWSAGGARAARAGPGRDVPGRPARASSSSTARSARSTCSGSCRSACCCRRAAFVAYSAVTAAALARVLPIPGARRAARLGGRAVRSRGPCGRWAWPRVAREPPPGGVLRAGAAEAAA